MPGIIQIINALLPSPMEALISLSLIAVGCALIPALAYFKLLHPKGIIGRIIWTLGAIALGPYALIQDDSGRYRLRWVSRVDDEFDWEGDHPGGIYTEIDGERVYIEEVPENWARLGKKPFAITYRKSERLFSDVLSDVGDALPDGGLEGERGGYHSYVPQTSDEGYVVRVHRLLERLREAGGSRLADIAEEEGLRRFGGNPDMSNWVLIAYVMAMLALGFVGGMWYVG